MNHLYIHLVIVILVDILVFGDYHNYNQRFLKLFLICTNHKSSFWNSLFSVLNKIAYPSKEDNTYQKLNPKVTISRLFMTKKKHSRSCLNFLKIIFVRWYKFLYVNNEYFHNVDVIRFYEYYFSFLSSWYHGKPHDICKKHIFWRKEFTWMNST